ncbi:MAG: C40 family peptidase [Bacteroidota bacterium]
MKNLLLYFFVIVSLFACHSKKSVSNHSNKSTHYETIKHTLQITDKEMQLPLYSFITEWYGVPYKYGECSKNGTDCSGFINALYEKVYGKKLERRSQDIFQKQCKKINKNEVKEGDLVFFKIESKEISHVGVYLRNNKFVHASTQKGVIINDLNEPYYQKYFYAFGRVK